MVIKYTSPLVIKYINAGLIRINKPLLVIPSGKLAAPNLGGGPNDQEAARKRKELREKLLRGEEVRISQSGTVKTPSSPGFSNKPSITVPPGKLASFYWYESDTEAFEEEQTAMRRFFPQFELSKLEDGRLYWHGSFETDLRPGGRWYLQAIYENNHPNNSNYGGSVKVYSIEPDLEEFQNQLGDSIPHLLRDEGGHLYLCTARREDVQVGNQVGGIVTSSASSLAWAVKWISAFELWLAGDLSTHEFAGHEI